MFLLYNFARKFNVCGLHLFGVNFVPRETFLLVSKSSPDVICKQLRNKAKGGD